MNVLHHAGKFTVRDAAHASLVENQSDNDFFRRVRLPRNLRCRKQSAHPVFTKPGEPARDGRIGKIQFGGACKRHDFAGQTRDNRVIPRLNVAGDRNVVKIERELNRQKSAVSSNQDQKNTEK